jgi:hypothetical protein
MKTLIRTKLLNNDQVEAKDYELFKDKIRIIHCIATDYKMCNHFNEDYQDFTLAQQKKGKVLNTQRSKFYPYAYYKIYTFKWKPTGQIPKVQEYKFIGNKAVPK